MRLYKLGLAAGVLFSYSFAAHGQAVTNYQVVSACGVPTSTYVPGTPRPGTVDTLGNFCSSSSGGGVATSVNVHDAAGNNVTSTGGALDVNVKSSGLANQSVNLTQVNGAATATGAGTAPGALRVELPTDGTGKVGLNAGAAVVGKVGIDQTTPGTTNAVQAIPGATGGLTIATITAANSTNATNLKATPGTLYHISGYTAAAVPTWVLFYNTAGTPTCTSGIVYEVLIPVNSTSGGGFAEDIAAGLNFGTGIGYCITTAIGGTGSVAASSIVVNFGYK